MFSHLGASLYTINSGVQQPRICPELCRLGIAIAPNPTTFLARIRLETGQSTVQLSESVKRNTRSTSSIFATCGLNEGIDEVWKIGHSPP